MPPFGVNHGNKIAAEWYIHWLNYTDKEGNDKIKPLVCTRKYEKYCPICEQANGFYQRKSELIKEFQDAEGKVQWKKVPAEIQAKYSELNDNWSKIRAQKGYYYNVMDLSGKIGVLKLPVTAHNALKAKILEALDKLSINPVSLTNGCFFVISKVKTGAAKWDVEYKVDFLRTTTKDEKGNIIEKIEISPVTDMILQNFATMAYDVHNLYTIRSAKDIVAIINGDTSLLEKEDAKKKNNTVSAPSESKPAPVSESTPAPVVNVMPPEAQPTVASQTTPVVEVATINQPASAVKINTVETPNNAAPKSLEDFKKILGY
jgi:hypothetical protein